MFYVVRCLCCNFFYEYEHNYIQLFLKVEFGAALDGEYDENSENLALCFWMKETLMSLMKTSILEAEFAGTKINLSGKN